MNEGQREFRAPSGTSGRLGRGLLVGLTFVVASVAVVLAVESDPWISIVLLAVLAFWIALHVFFFKTPTLTVAEDGITIVGYRRKTHLDWSEVQSMHRSGSILVIVDRSGRSHRCPSVANTISEQSKGTGYVERTIAEIGGLRASWRR